MEILTDIPFENTIHNALSSHLISFLSRFFSRFSFASLISLFLTPIEIRDKGEWEWKWYSQEREKSQPIPYPIYPPFWLPFDVDLPSHTPIIFIIIFNVSMLNDCLVPVWWSRWCMQMKVRKMRESRVRSTDKKPSLFHCFWLPCFKHFPLWEFLLSFSPLFLLTINNQFLPKRQSTNFA